MTRYKINPFLVAHWFVALGAVAAFIGVGAGAFGAHALKDALTPDLMRSYQTAVLYQLVHALGLVAVGLSDRVFGGSVLMRLSGLMMLLGLVLFCGSLYVLALTGLRWAGLITPLGGIAFLVGWLCLAAGIVRRNRARLGRLAPGFGVVRESSFRAHHGMDLRWFLDPGCSAA